MAENTEGVELEPEKWNTVTHALLDIAGRSWVRGGMADELEDIVEEIESQR